MNILVVLAHPEGQSFNGALRDVSVATLSSAGHSVFQSDLYAMDFKAVLARDDFVEQGDTEIFNVQSSQRTAVANGTQAEDVVREQAKLEQADLVILHFPIWWFGVPAILKGWIDRTFALGMSYGGGRWFDHGVYRGKRVVFCVTTGARSDRFSETGLFGPLDWVLHPLRVGTFNFCGFDTLEPFVAWAAGNSDRARRSDYLAAWQERLRSVDTETPQSFRHLSVFPSSTMRDH